MVCLTREIINLVCFSYYVAFYTNERFCIFTISWTSWVPQNSRCNPTKQL